jgi:hypothetical protein
MEPQPNEGRVTDPLSIAGGARDGRTLGGEADETIRGSVFDRLYDRWLYDIASCRECAK